MAKFFQRVFTTKEFFYLQMKILSVDISVKELTTDVIIEWKRGHKKSQAKGSEPLSPLNHVTLFDQTFKKMSVFFKDEKKGNFLQS